MAALKHDEQNVREKAIQFLQPHETELFKHLRYMENREGRRITKMTAETFKKDRQGIPGGCGKKLLENISFTQQEKENFSTNARILEARWEAPITNHDNLLPVILATVNHDQIRKYHYTSIPQTERRHPGTPQRADQRLNQEDKTSELIASAIEYGSDAALKTILENASSGYQR